jgi:hypothetical protein
MTNRQRRYWAIRTDKENRELLLTELYAGRLRQGWGSDPQADLRVIQEELLKGGNWFERLSEAQRLALPQMRMLAASNDSIQSGDWILIPNLPVPGSFHIAEVNGDYSYSPLTLSEEQDINELGQDYGHLLPVRLMTTQGVDKYAEGVHADLRRTLRTVSRMWNVDRYAQALIAVVAAQAAGKDLSIRQSGTARIEKAWEIAFLEATNHLRTGLEKELQSRFKAAEWEEPVKAAIANLFPGADVR